MRIESLLAKGVTAEAVVRTLADSLNEDWQVYLETANNLSDLDAAATATAKAEAIAKYRALVEAVVTVWDTDAAEQTAKVVPVRSGDHA